MALVVSWNPDSHILNAGVVFQRMEDFPLLLPHSSGLNGGPLVVVAEEVKDAVDQKKENFILEGHPFFLRVPGGGLY